MCFKVCLFACLPGKVFYLIAATSLLKWPIKEKNDELKESICQLYDISLIWVTVQREFSEKVCVEPNRQLHV